MRSDRKYGLGDNAPSVRLRSGYRIVGKKKYGLRKERARN
jgi:hypothetical protein